MRNGGFWSVVADVVVYLTFTAVLAVDALVVYYLFVECHPGIITNTLVFAFCVQFLLCFFGCGLQYVRKSLGARLATRVLWAHFVVLVTTAMGLMVLACVFGVVELF